MGTRKSAANERSIAKEAAGLALIAVGLLATLSLFTYDPNDPSFNVAGGQDEVSNLVGRFGAVLADLLLQALGLLALLVPAMLIVLGVRAVAFNRAGVPVRLAAGLGLAALALGGLLSVLPSPELAWLANSSATAGMLGLLVARAFTAVFNRVGAAIVLAISMVVVLMLTLRVSLFEAVGRARGGQAPKPAGALDALSTLRGRIATWWAERAAARRAAREARVPLEGAHSDRELREMERTEDVSASARERELRRAAEEKVREGLMDPSEERPVVRPLRATRRSQPLESADDSTAARATLPRTDRLPEVLGPHEEDAPPFAASGAPPQRQPERISPAAAARARLAEIRGRKAAEEDTAGQTGPRPAVIRAASGASPDAPPPPDIDPDVVEMISTASIVRTELSRPSKAKLPSQPVSTETGYVLPSTELLTPAPDRSEQDERELEQRAITLAEKCKEFSVTGHIHRINPGPVVTTFEFKPDPGVKYSRIVSLADDLCLALKAESIRIDRIPGKSTVGIEVPNEDRETIYLRDVIESDAFQQSPSKLTLALGRTIDGQEYVADLQKMPHLLIAGSTGSGKSVMVNTIVTSILCKAAPDEVKFIMVDPKRLELGLYEGVPHLLTPIVVDPKRAANALKWAVTEMENRYRTLAGYGVRNIEQYNREVRAIVNQRMAAESEELPKPLPYIVVLIDELADLMMVASSEVESSITRLAQMARAIGIHLVLATQRPSVDVITGLIKANFPSRMSFRVSSKVDSRTIIDTNGAEQLLGQGDSLFLPPGTSRLVRVHGSFVSETDVKNITTYIKQQGEPTYDESVTLSAAESDGAAGGGEQDELFNEALKIVCDMGRASTSVLQRRLRIGYGRAAAILDQMEQSGFVGPPDGSRPRTVLQLAYEFRERNDQILEERPDEA